MKLLTSQKQILDPTLHQVEVGRIVALEDCKVEVLILKYGFWY